MTTPMTDDPLLQPFRLRHLTLRNRVISSSHEPAYSEDGMPTDRYRRTTWRRPRAASALTMTAGSAVVAEDSPPAFGNLHAYRDEIVPWMRRMTDEVHEHGAAVMIQLTHLGRRTGWAQDDWLPVVAPSAAAGAGAPGHPQGGRGLGHRAHRRPSTRMPPSGCRPAGMDGIEIEAYGHLFDQFWSPVTNRRDRRVRRLVREPAALRLARCSRAIRERVGPDFIVGIRMAVDERIAGGIDAPSGLVDPRNGSRPTGSIDFVNVIRGNIASDAVLIDVIPIHGMASAPHLDFAGDGARQRPACRCSTRRRSTTWPRPATPSARARSTWSA